MRMADLALAMGALAPLSLAEAWDNVGLLVGDASAELGGLTLLTIDLTDAVAQEAESLRAGAIVAYHPPIFRARQRLTADDDKGRALLRVIRAGMGIYSPHTALDSVQGGVTDWLCDMLAPAGATPTSIGDRRALAPHASVRHTETFKIVTFVPRESLEQVRNALASIGAGRIGAYELCSFMLEGRGTFRGSASTRPAVGEAGAFETAEEVRLEMVCPGDAVGLAHEMLKRFHPYEEPAWDVYPLAPKPDRSVGAGRRVTLDQPASAVELGARLKTNLGLDAVKIAAHDSSAPIERVGVCPGAGASLVEAAIADGCQAFLTGEMTHHEAMAAVDQGCAVILCGHTNTERGYLPTLAEGLNEISSEFDARVSGVDGPLFRTM